MLFIGECQDIYVYKWPHYSSYAFRISVREPTEKSILQVEILLVNINNFQISHTKKLALILFLNNDIYLCVVSLIQKVKCTRSYTCYM